MTVHVPNIEPITAEAATAARVRPLDVRADAAGVVWSESRPHERGRVALVRLNQDSTRTDLLPPWADVRSRVHEYGGGAWWVRDGSLWFTHWADQRLYYLARTGDEPVALTPSPEIEHGVRYADGDVSADGTWLVCVRETHDMGQVRNEVVRLRATAPGPVEVLVSGPDFVTHPRLRADGGALCWIQWNRPALPWQESTLVVRDLASGRDQVVAGGRGESVSQPSWSPRGGLRFLSDRSGWSTLYRWTDGRVRVEVPIDADIGEPDWYLGASRYAVSGDAIVFAHRRGFRDRLAWCRLADPVTELSVPLTAVSAVRTDSDGSVLVVGASFTEGPGVYRIRLPGGTLEPLRGPEPVPIPPHQVARPVELGVPAEDSEHGPYTVPVLFYAPIRSTGERPPLLLTVHGGPTSSAYPGFQPQTQYWTTRGFAVADVNYRGSSGCGRRYRELLDGRWGVADVDDCVLVARFLVARGLVDASRLHIRGSSSGGYTALMAMTRSDCPFTSCVDYFGVTDLRRLASTTHKFESHYLTSLLGALSEHELRYDERSPVNLAEHFRGPLLIVQGGEDPVVPPEQSSALAARLRQRGIAVDHLLFEGESHGLRRAENIVRALETEHAFYERELT